MKQPEPPISPSLASLASQLPAGAGLGLRPALWHDLINDQYAERIDFLEVVIDDYLDLSIADAVKLLRPITERYPLVAHGVSLSVGSAEGIDVDYVERVARFLDALRIEVYSEHLSFRRAGGYTLGQFVPVPFTAAWAERVAANVCEVQRIIGRKMLLENVSYLLGHAHPHAHADAPEMLGEPAFVCAVAEQADCGLLLDVTNVLTNGANLGYTPTAYVDALPTERILQAHMAGGHVAHTDDDGRGGLYIDSHGFPVPDEAYALLAYAATNAPLRTALLERDKHFPPFAELLDELSGIRIALDVASQQGAVEEGKEATGEVSGRWGAAMAYEVRKPPCKASGAIPAIDDVAPEKLQAHLAEALSIPGRYKALRRDEDSLGNGEGARIRAYLLSFPVEHVKAFARILQFKRRELITGLLHGVCRHLEVSGRLVDLLGLYFMETPEGDLGKLDDALGFADYLQAQEGLPLALRELALHERTTLALRALPYRFWHPLTMRKTLTLRCDPRDLEAAIHGELPMAQDRPLRVRYVRKKMGIWVEPLGASA